MTIGKGIVTTSIGINGGILIVNSIDFGRFENHFRIDFRRSEGRRCVSGKKGITRTRPKNNDPPLF